VTAPSLRLVHADPDGRYYTAACPGCGFWLTWAAETPPIPMTVFRWFHDDRPVQECPECGNPLPEGDIRREHD
jgi:endogenous inhibitor of DNA gyrase (YacG/DUF329 family)